MIEQGTETPGTAQNEPALEGAAEGNRLESPARRRMDAQDNKISVWVCQEEKLISGLSRRTTCADVISALLEEAALSALLSGAPDTYCLVEKWRGFERTLPNKTKILRLWQAWGEERDKVTFVLEKTRAALGRAGVRSAQARVVASRDNPCKVRGAGGAGLAMSRDKQRRVVRKAFRKLAKMNRSKRREGGPKEERCGERMETLVHRVLSQDHTIRQQLERLRELDRDIDLCEARIHLDRMRKHGANYVQDTYLEGGPAPCRDAAEGQAEEGAAAEGPERREEGAEAAAEEEENPEVEVEMGSTGLDPDQLREQLQASLRLGLRLSSDLEECRRALERSRSMRRLKREELERLLRELRELSSSPEPPARDTTTTDRAGEEGDSADDSDTGLSSMNSLDSDPAPVAESLV
ncbi:ras association domain-containing protein 10-like [Mobula birostris]|uniref:ras association domain-containing protein 10-like n=1 Tax=Mobula birostris TaxID=1983395 RepID=UPI003B28CC3E